MPSVYLSPSTRSFNRGYGTFGTEEQRMNLIADIVELELARNGVTTYRNNPAYDLTSLVNDANTKGADIYVALRSLPCTRGAQGARILYFRNGSSGQRLAQDLYNQLSLLTPTQDRGTEDGGEAFGGQGFYELRRTRAPAVIIDLGCHNDPQQADFLVRNVYEIGVAVARGILTYFNLPYTPPDPTAEQSLRSEYNSIYF